jgi:hypothetical protein
MSVFTSRVTKDIPVGDQTVVIRKLAPRHLEKAAKEAQRKSLDDFKAMGGAAFLKEWQDVTDKKPDAPDVAPDPMHGYDAVTLLESGIVSWTFTEKDADDKDVPVALTRENIEDLDDETLTLLSREVLMLSKPSLFGDQEAARKNA